VAIWQFSIDLIPREPIVARFGAVPADLPDGDDAWLWSWQPPPDYSAVIEAFAQPYTPWSADIQMWGAEAGDRVHVIHDDGRVVGIACRLDLRTFSTEFARGLLRLARHCDGLLLTRQSGLIPPTWEALVAALRESNELRFVTDPIEFFRELSIGEVKA
jgi:hypothetical protein